MDGATRWQTFRHITLPLLRPTIALMLVLSITGSLLAFDQFFILTRGGPDNSTVSMVMVIYREAFTRFDLGSAAAISVVLLVGPGGAQRAAAARARAPRGEDVMKPSKTGDAAFYVTGAALAVLFLFPLVWSGFSSVSGQPGTSQESGFGFGNYASDGALRRGPRRPT